MSELMNETGDIDTIAAEYVLGTLDAGERARAQALLAVDHALAAKVRIWERRLSELHLMVEPIEPEDEIWERIERRIPRPEPVPPPPPTPAPVATPEVAPVLAAPPVATPAAPPPPAPEIKPAPERAALPPPTFTFGPAAQSERGAAGPVKDRPSLESLEEAVLRAADDLQRRATAEPVVEPVAEPEPEPLPEPAVEPDAELAEADLASAEPEPGPEEADGKTQEDVGIVPEEPAKSAEEAPKTDETPAPATAADEEPAPSGVFDDMPEPTPAGPLAAFPTPFTASAPVPTPASPVPAASAIPVAPPPVAPPSPSVAIRPTERRPQPLPAPKSRWLARTIATLATLILLAIAGLVAAWRFAPERVPQPLQPVELLRAAGIPVPVKVVGPPPRRPAPPESQYDE
ncbi:MAG: hypothetical protein AB7K78_08180 [Xanthobacteraceae bacterium]